MADLIDKGTENIVAKFGCQGTNHKCAYAIITSLKKKSILSICLMQIQMFLLSFLLPKRPGCRADNESHYKPPVKATLAARLPQTN